MEEEANQLMSIAILVICMLIYFVPTFVSVERNHRNKWAIAVLNFFLGWTFLGWVLSLVWSMTANVHDRN